MAAAPDNNASRAQEIVQRLRVEFIEDAIDRLDKIEEVLDHAFAGAVEDGDVLSLIRREAHSIKGMGGSFGFPLITSVAHRLEDYLSGVTDLAEQRLRDAMLFTDVMREVVEDGENPDTAVSELVLKKLPTKWTPAPLGQGAANLNLEILVCIEAAVLRTVIGKQMAALGCRTLSAHSPFEIIQLVVTNKPDAVIMTTVMDGLWGADVARALAAMQVTRDIPVALLTSFEDDRIGSLPEDTILIHEDKRSLQRGLELLCDRIKAQEKGSIYSLLASA